MNDTSTSSAGFLGDLSSILTGYLGARANLLINNAAGGAPIPDYIDAQNQGAPTPPVTKPTSAFGTSLTSAFHSPTVLIGLAAVAVLLVVLVMNRK